MLSVFYNISTSAQKLIYISFDIFVHTLNSCYSFYYGHSVIEVVVYYWFTSLFGNNGHLSAIR